MKYRWWELLDEMPKGWQIDKHVGSPLFGYEFVTNGKSQINGQKRALLRVVPAQKTLLLENKPIIANVIAPTEDKRTNSANAVIDQSSARAVQELAREKFKLSLLNDIITDLMICEIEGWCKTEYIDSLKSMILSIGKGALIEQGRWPTVSILETTAGSLREAKANI